MLNVQCFSYDFFPANKNLQSLHDCCQWAEQKDLSKHDDT